MAIPFIATASLTGCYTITGGTVFDYQSQRFYAFEVDRWSNLNAAMCPDSLEIGNEVEEPPKRRNTRRVWLSDLEAGTTQDAPMRWRNYRRATFYECTETGEVTE